jgi:hypothetical protein
MDLHRPDGTRRMSRRDRVETLPRVIATRRALFSALVAALLAACQATQSPIAPTGPATPGLTASSPASTPAASATAAAPAINELPGTGVPLAAGRYTRAAFLPRITLEVEGGQWTAVNLLSGFFDIEDAPGTPDVIAIQFALPSGIYGAGTSPERPANAADAVAILGRNPSLVVVESSVSRMDGMVGSQVTVENPATGISTARIMDLPPGALGIDPGRRLWIACFDTDVGLLAVMVGGSVAQWDAALLRAEPVLESVTIGE